MSITETAKKDAGCKCLPLCHTGVDFGPLQCHLKSTAGFLKFKVSNLCRASPC